MRHFDPHFRMPSAIELDGVTADPFASDGPQTESTQIAPLLVAGLIAGGAALAGGATGLIANKKKDVQSYDIKEEAFDNPYFKSSRSAAIMEKDAAKNREAPTATSAQQGGIREYAGARLGPAERMQAAQLGPAAQGTAERAGYTNIDRGEDRQFRSGQAELAAQLAAQARGEGPSLAEAQLRAATDRNVKQQMAMAASAAGGNAALAQRNVQQNAAAAGQQLAADAAQARIQEQLAARQQLAGVLESGRAQDIGVAQSQAQLLQQINLANQAAGNQFGLANMDAQNQFALQQAQLEQQSRLQNMDAGNQFALQRAQLQQQAGLASQAQFNEMLARNTQNEQQVRLANMETQLRQTGMNDEQIRSMMQMQLAQEEAQRQAMMDKERLEVQQNAAMQGIALQAHEGAANRTQSIIGGMFGGIGSGAAAAVSDPKAKSGMKSMLNGKLKVEKRAAGGPVAAGRPYLVGEKGPELMVPAQNGRIVPNDSLPRSTWGTGGPAPEAIIAANKQDQLDKRGLDLAIQRSVTRDAALDASNKAEALKIRQGFEKDASDEEKAKFKAGVEKLGKGLAQQGQTMASIDTSLPKIERSDFSPGPRTQLAQYLSQFSAGRRY